MAITGRNRHKEALKTALRIAGFPLILEAIAAFSAKASENPRIWRKRRKVNIEPFHTHLNSILAALKAPRHESPGQRPGFRNPSIVWRPERAQESLRPFRAGRSLAGTIPGALPRAGYLRAVGAKSSAIFPNRRKRGNAFRGILPGEQQERNKWRSHSHDWNDSGILGGVPSKLICLFFVWMMAAAQAFSAQAQSTQAPAAPGQPAPQTSPAVPQQTPPAPAQPAVEPAAPPQKTLAVVVS